MSRDALRILAEDLRLIESGELPDGDGVQVSVSLWAARRLPLVLAALASPPAAVAVTDDGLRGSLTNLATALDEWTPKGDTVGPLWSAGMVFAYRDTAQAIRKILASPSGPVLAASPSGVGGGES